MTGPKHDPAVARALFDAVGAEQLVEQTVLGPPFVFTGFPNPDGSVQVLLGLQATAEGMTGIRVIVTADQARRMAELLLRVAAR